MDPTDDIRMKKQIYENVLQITKNKIMPHEMFEVLVEIKTKELFYPRYVYDIGSCVLHWTRICEAVFPSSEIFLFDAWKYSEILYDDYDYHIGLLGAEKGNAKFYTNDFLPGGNSVYIENSQFFNEAKCDECDIRTLDDVCAERRFPLPDLIKIDVQGSELNILKGAENCLYHARYIIIEIQNDDSNYNLNSPKFKEVDEYLQSINYKLVKKITENVGGIDCDYLYINKKFIE